MKKIVALVTSLVLGLSLSSCSNLVPAGDVYNQQLNWSLCEDQVFQCAKINVPLDWDKPEGETIELSMIRKFTNNAIGSLLINPGGPGGSGYDYLSNNWADIGTAGLRSTYTFVSFDPRGVSRSAPVKCYDAKKKDELLYSANDAEPGSAEDVKLLRASMKEYVASCEKNTGKVLGELDTVSAARDMDVIRAALGDSKLNYLGFSYGTFLGTTYATLFPDKVGRFVLDGAIDPRVSDEQQSLNQLAGFDLALTNYLNDCINKDAECPFQGNLWTAKQEVTKFLKKMEKTTLPTEDGRKLTITSSVTGLIMALYSDTYWIYLSQAFKEAFEGNGTTFIRLADFYNDRQSDGTYTGNTLESNIAINCLDSRSSSKPEKMAEQNRRLLQVSPILGRYWQNGALTCEQWPYPVAKRPESYAAQGAPTILVIGTTGDPATPYEQAVGLAREVLADGFLLTFKGEGHTAYGRSNLCISDVVDNFLIEGTLPEKEPTC